MRYFILCILLALTTCLYADDPKHADQGKAILAELRNSIEVLRNQGQAAVARTEKTFDTEVEKLKEKALMSLKSEMDDAIEAKDLDGAIALRELIKNTENLDAGNVTKSTIVVNEVKKTEPKAEAPPKPSIPKNAVQFGGHHYQLVDNGVSWLQSVKEAKRLGGHLLRIGSVAEHTFVKGYLNRFNSRSIRHVWIDGTLALDGKRWLCEDGQPVELHNFSNKEIERGPEDQFLVLVANLRWEVADCGFWVTTSREVFRNPYIIEWDN